MPSFRSSPWIRGAPHSGFSRLMRLIRARTSRGIGGRPPLRRRDFHVQYSRKPFRWQPMTVSGFTITSISRAFGKSRDRSTQSRRSVGRGRRPPGGSLHRGELMPNSNELKLERCAPTEAVAEC